MSFFAGARQSELESALLGLIMQPGSVGDEAMDAAVTEGIDAECFTAPLHALAWTVLLDGERSGKRPDPVELGARLSSDPTDDRGASLWIRMMELAPVSTNPAYYAKEIAAGRWLRRTHAALQTVQSQLVSYEPGADLESIRLALTKTLSDLADSGSSRTARSMSDICESLVADLQERATRFASGLLPGITTGWPSLDRILGGWCGGRVYTLAAHTGRGKTTLMCNWARTALKAGKRVLVFSLEMTAEDIAEKILSREARLPFQRLQSGDFNADRYLDDIVSGVQTLSAFQLLIDDDFGADLGRIEQLARRYHRRGQCDLIVIDYLQLLNVADMPPHASRQQIVTEITRRIKRLASSLNVPIIQLAQFNRSSNPSEEPEMRHLKESSSIEQDSDVVMFAHSEEIDARTVEHSLIIAKHRRGQMGRFPMSVDLAVNFMEEAQP